VHLLGLRISDDSHVLLLMIFKTLLVRMLDDASKAITFASIRTPQYRSELPSFATCQGRKEMWQMIHRDERFSPFRVMHYLWLWQVAAIRVTEASLGHANGLTKLTLLCQSKLLLGPVLPKDRAGCVYGLIEMT
jgi:hypothetical protein